VFSFPEKKLDTAVTEDFLMLLKYFSITFQIMLFQSISHFFIAGTRPIVKHEHWTATNYTTTKERKKTNYMKLQIYKRLLALLAKP